MLELGDWYPESPGDVLWLTWPLRGLPELETEPTILALRMKIEALLEQTQSKKV